MSKPIEPPKSNPLQPPQSRQGDSTTRPTRPQGGLFSQLLELFGMTPSVQSGPTGVKRDERISETITPPPPQVRCRACYNPAAWDTVQETWYCSDHPNAEMMEP